jgi:NhaP-type Na+/H+ and K+/H+ antiporter
MMQPRCVLVEPLDRDAFVTLLEDARVDGAPFVDSAGQYIGVVTLSSLQRRGNVSSGAESDAPLDVVFAPVYDDTHLDVVLDVLTSTPQTWATVVDHQRRVLGTISLSDIVRNYQRTARTYLRRLSEAGGATGVAEVSVEVHSPLTGLSLRSSVFPRGVLVTTIERGSGAIRPTGDTVLEPGDRLTVLGSSGDITRLENLSRTPVPKQE